MTTPDKLIPDGTRTQFAWGWGKGAGTQSPVQHHWNGEWPSESGGNNSVVHKLCQSSSHRGLPLLSVAVNSQLRLGNRAQVEGGASFPGHSDYANWCTLALSQTCENPGCSRSCADRQQGLLSPCLVSPTTLPHFLCHHGSPSWQVSPNWSHSVPG